MSVKTRIKLFNKILCEFIQDLDGVPASIVKKSMVTKFCDLDLYNKYITENIDKVLQRDPMFISEIKVFSKFKGYILIDSETIPHIYDYIKNLYYITIEDQEEAKRQRAIMDIDVNQIITDFSSGKMPVVLQKLVSEIEQEVKPYVEQHGIDITQINITQLLGAVTSGAVTDGQQLLHSNNPEDAEKLAGLERLIKDFVKKKMESGEFSQKDLKKMFGFLKK